MEEKEKETVEIISSEMVDKVINSFNKFKEKSPEFKEGEVDTEKVKEVLESFKGCTSHTVAGIIGVAFLLLPLGAIRACLKMGEQVISAKALLGIMKMAGKCPACSEEKAPEAPKAPETLAE